MTKLEFLARLQEKLRSIPEEDRQRTLDYYEEMIDDRMEEGLPEEDAVADVGDVEKIAESVLSEAAAAIPAAPSEDKPKKRRWGWIVALAAVVALVVTAGILGVFGLSLTGRSNGMIEREEMIRESFAGVLVDTADCDVTVVSCPETEKARVVIWEREKTPHSVRVEDGILQIRMQDKRSWLDHIGIFWESMKMTVYLPQKQYDYLQTTTATGNIEIPQTLSAKEVMLESDTGYIQCAAGVMDLLESRTDTGSIRVSGCTPEKLQLNSDTGYIELINIPQGGTVAVKGSTGAVVITDVACQTLDAKTATGEIKLTQVLADAWMQIESDTGDVKLKDCDSAQLTIETETGDVSGTFLTPKFFDAKTATGDVRVTNSREGDPCYIRTATGDITFE